MRPCGRRSPITSRKFKMGDWSSYSLSDFLLFSPQVYERLFVLHNQDMWPAQFIWLLLGAGALASVWRARSSGPGAALVILGAAWLSVASTFFLGRYQEINWLGAYIAPLAGLQGGALIAYGLWGGARVVLPRQDRFPFFIGTSVLAFGLTIYPLLAGVSGTGLSGSQVFGLTPDPTAVATLGGLALLTGWPRYFLALIPASWCVFAALTLSTLGRGDYVIAPVLMAVAVIAMGWPRSRQTKSKQLRADGT